MQALQNYFTGLANRLEQTDQPELAALVRPSIITNAGMKAAQFSKITKTTNSGFEKLCGFFRPRAVTKKQSLRQSLSSKLQDIETTHTDHRESFRLVIASPQKTNRFGIQINHLIQNLIKVLTDNQPETQKIVLGHSGLENMHAGYASYEYTYSLFKLLQALGITFLYNPDDSKTPPLVKYTGSTFSEASNESLNFVSLAGLELSIPLSEIIECLSKNNDKFKIHISEERSETLSLNDVIARARENNIYFVYIDSEWHAIKI